jgi:hypothetical protein
MAIRCGEQVADRLKISVRYLGECEGLHSRPGASFTQENPQLEKVIPSGIREERLFFPEKGLAKNQKFCTLRAYGAFGPRENDSACTCNSPLRYARHRRLRVPFIGDGDPPESFRNGQSCASESIPETGSRSDNKRKQRNRESDTCISLPHKRKSSLLDPGMEVVGLFQVRPNTRAS